MQKRDKHLGSFGNDLSLLVNRKNMDPQNLHVFGKKSYWVY
jgi:hypothetical protein